MWTSVTTWVQWEGLQGGGGPLGPGGELGDGGGAEGGAVGEGLEGVPLGGGGQGRHQPQHHKGRGRVGDRPLPTDKPPRAQTLPAAYTRRTRVRTINPKAHRALRRLGCSGLGGGCWVPCFGREGNGGRPGSQATPGAEGGGGAKMRGRRGRRRPEGRAREWRAPWADGSPPGIPSRWPRSSRYPAVGARGGDDGA